MDTNNIQGVYQRGSRLNSIVQCLWYISYKSATNDNHLHTLEPYLVDNFHSLFNGIKCFRTTGMPRSSGGYTEWHHCGTLPCGRKVELFQHVRWDLFGVGTEMLKTGAHALVCQGSPDRKLQHTRRVLWPGREVLCHSNWKSIHRRCSRERNTHKGIFAAIESITAWSSKNITVPYPAAYSLIFVVFRLMALSEWSMIVRWDGCWHQSQGSPSPPTNFK